jgi:hypothetical protein
MDDILYPSSVVFLIEDYDYIVVDTTGAVTGVAGTIVTIPLPKGAQFTVEDPNGSLGPLIVEGKVYCIPVSGLNYGFPYSLGSYDIPVSLLQLMKYDTDGGQCIK